MEEMESITTQVEPEEAKPEPSRWYEGHISLEDAKTFIKSNITTAARSFIAIGFYLKCVRDRELFKEENYGTVWEFAKEEYGISKSTASRYMSMNDRFSENGNSPNVQEEYRAFDKSKLQEMLYLEDEQLKQVTPEYRVEDIRNLRKPKEIPYIELPGQMDFEIDFPDILPRNQLEQPLISQRQTFEMNVEDLLGDNEPGSIAISQQEKNQDFSTTPSGCPHRTGYSCTIPEDNRTIPGNENNCGSSCCWSCKFHGACKLECNASAGRDGTVPEYDAAWFVRKWAEVVPEELERVLKACRESSNTADRAKAVQKEISPYGAYSRHCWEYSFSFHGFAGGMDFRIGKVEIHLKYGRFVQELMYLYLDFEKPESKEPETVIEELGNVSEQGESVSEYYENVIGGEYVEISPGPEPAEPEQPELSILKNNVQRAAFIDTYATWPIWIDQKETEERYYRYNLTDKVSMVVKVSRKHSWASYKESKDYEYGAEQYYLLGVKSEWYNGKNVYVEDESRTFYECGTNRSALVEYLKDFQKSK